MNWEMINGLTGLISAFCALAGIGYFGFSKPSKDQASSEHKLNISKFVSFSIACSGWALCCLSYLWVFEPYGVFPSDSEFQQFFGIILAFPAITIFSYGMGLLSRKEDD